MDVKSLGVLVLAAAMAAGLTAQELTVTNTVTVVGETTLLFQLPFRCDADSNVFFLPGNPEGTPPDTVVKLFADGRRSVRYSVKSIPDFRDVSDGAIYAAAPGYSGELYMLVGNAEGASIVALDKGGAYRSKTRLAHLRLGQFAVFRSGEFLLWGQSVGQSAEGQPWLGILGGGGEPRELFLDWDQAPRPRTTTEAGPGILAGDTLLLLEPGKDGRIYAARVPPKGSVPVLAISPSGDVTHRITVVPPKRDTTLVSFKVSDRRLAAVFEGSPTNPSADPPRWVTVYDLLSGEKTATYTGVHGQLLCYQSGDGVPDAFRFLLGSEGKGIRLVDALGGY